MNQALQFTEAVMLRTLDQLTGISHNIANVNTPGYKAQRSFAQVVDAIDFGAQPLMSERPQLSMAQGLAAKSDSPYHLMLDGQGFFAVTTADNQTLLTRKGDFQVDDSGALVTIEGYRVAGEMGDIRLTGEERIAADGSIFMDKTRINQLQIVRANTQALVAEGAGYYRSAAPVSPAEAEDYSVRQGMLESANVDAAAEFTRMMTTMRQFEMQQKVVRVYDQLLSSGITTLGEF